MKKNKKIKSYFSIDSIINEDFEDFLEKNYINKSKLIEGLILDYMKNEKNNKLTIQTKENETK